MLRLLIPGGACLCLLLPAPISQSQAKSLIEHDSTVAKPEPGPHNDGGQTTGYSFFSQHPNSAWCFANVHCTAALRSGITGKRTTRFITS